MSHQQPSSCMWLYIYMLPPGMSLCPISSHLVVCGYIYIYIYMLPPGMSLCPIISHLIVCGYIYIYIYMLPPGMSLCPIISLSRYYCSNFLLSPSCSLARHLLFAAQGFHLSPLSSLTCCFIYQGSLLSAFSSAGLASIAISSSVSHSSLLAYS